MNITERGGIITIRGTTTGEIITDGGGTITPRGGIDTGTDSGARTGCIPPH